MFFDAECVSSSALERHRVSSEVFGVLALPMEILPPLPVKSGERCHDEALAPGRIPLDFIRSRQSIKLLPQ